MTSQEFLELLLSVYSDMPDDATISIGHWEQVQANNPFPPQFYADIGLTIAELKKLAGK